MTKDFNILFTCIGRRVSLLNLFRNAAKDLGLQCSFIGTDIVNTSPALHLCDDRFVVKRFDHKDYINQILKIVCENIETLQPISVMMGSGKIYRREFLKSNKSN